MKTFIQDSVGEKRVVLCDEQGPRHIIIKRDLCLNYGDIVEAKIGPYAEGLYGYFAETSKGSVFLPIKNIFTEGERVRVQITKEPREEKCATGTLDIQEKPDFKGEEISEGEMDALISGAMEKDIPLADGAQIHIEHTKVAWTIDVDTGKSLLGLDEVNCQAASLIARHISLKNMGGLILIDFAGSKRVPYRLKLEKEIKKQTGDDELIRVCGWTKAGLFELERKRGRADLWQVCDENNPVAVYYRVRRALKACKSGKAMAKVAPEVLKLLRQAQVPAEALFNQPIAYFEIEES